MLVRVLHKHWLSPLVAAEHSHSTWVLHMSYLPGARGYQFQLALLAAHLWGALQAAVSFCNSVNSSGRCAARHA